MRHIITLTIILGLISCDNHNGINIKSSNQQFESIPIWILVAQSNCVLETNIDLPLNDIDNMFEKENFDYITLKLPSPNILKGNYNCDTIIAKMFIGKFKKEIFDSLNNKTCIIFLSDVSREIGINDFYVRYISKSSMAKENLVINESETQKKIFKDYSKYSQRIDFFGENTITGLIENIVNPLKGYNTIDTLNKIDSSYLPAIIRHMNDFRLIKENSICLKNEPGFWEDYRQYGPEKVIDYLAAVLNDKSGYSFGDIYNGKINDAIRQDTYNGWIVWLYNKNEINTILQIK